MLIQPHAASYAMQAKNISRVPAPRGLQSKYTSQPVLTSAATGSTD